MTQSGHILIVDDDRDFTAIYEEILQKQGLLVTIAHSAEDATRALERAGATFDVVLLDQRLQGSGGPDSGLDLISTIDALAPFAKTIVVTGYAGPDAIERAFRSGVYDYLVKNGAFEALVRAKVRNAVEVTTEQRRAALSRDQIVSELRDVWHRARTERDANRKGKLLEETVTLLFRATPGFERVTARLSNAVEEIDIKVDNRSDDPRWRNEGPYFIGECKNWSTKVGTPEVRNFRGKLTAKYKRVQIGFLIAPGGFAETVAEELRKHQEKSLLIIPLNAEDLERWIASDDRVAVLGEFHERAVFDLDH